MIKNFTLSVISGFRRDVALFWDITQRRVVIHYRRFGTAYRSHLQKVNKSKKKKKRMGPIGCPETSVKDYLSTLRNIPEQRSFNNVVWVSVKL